MRLYLIASDPANRPASLRLAFEGESLELVVHLEHRLRKPIAACSEVTVEGVATHFDRKPFRLTLEQGKVLKR